MSLGALTSSMVIAVLAFVAATLLVIGTARLYLEAQDKRRLRKVIAPIVDVKSEQSRRQKLQASKRLQHALQTLSRLSVPEDGWQSDKVRLRFLRAGFGGPTAPRTYYAIKTALTLIAPVVLGVGYDVLNPGERSVTVLAVILTFAALGYYLPEIFIHLRTQARVDEMRVVLPDVSDLLLICTESGLGLDQALGRVSQEISRSSPMVAAEFQLTNLEIRAGASRSTALRNLALRVKLEDLSRFAAMLIQADRFGTGIATALRIQSETMRGQRMQRAEEAAAKVPTKMLLPLVFCIFPVLMTVILGPAVIRLLSIMSDTPVQ